jgi:hypothetical protein
VRKLHHTQSPGKQQISQIRNAYKILVGKPEGKRPLGRHRSRWKDNIKIDIREIVWEGVDWMNLDQDRDQCRVHVDTVMKLRVS